MDVQTKAAMTIEEFIAWDDQQEGRHEFDGKAVVEMPDVTCGHARIVANLMCAVASRLCRMSFAPIESNFRLKAGSAVRLPVFQVYRHVLDNRSTLGKDPVAVFEVVSPGNAYTCRIRKPDDYWRTSSIRHFVLVEEEFAGVTILTRTGEGWISRAVDEDDSIELPALNVTISSRELYVDIGK